MLGPKYKNNKMTENKCLRNNSNNQRNQLKKQ